MKVAIIMGSDSDLPRLERMLDHLRKLEIEFELRVLSAHRTPSELLQYVEESNRGDVGIFICAAGGAAHLAGIVAAHTLRPVIGIPMDNPPFGGLDALLSTVQMPAGVPVASMAAGAGGPINAALCAARMLALNDPKLTERLDQMRAKMSAAVLKKNEKVKASQG